MKEKMQRTIFIIILASFFINLIFMTLQTQGQEEVPVSIYKNGTRFSSTSPTINDSVSLIVAIENSGKNYTTISIHIYSRTLQIIPMENRTLNIPPGYETTNFEYQITSNKTGEFQIIIDLYYKGELVDFHTLSINFKNPPEPIVLSFNHTILFVIYAGTIFLIFIIYLKSFYGVRKIDWTVLIILFVILAYASLGYFSKIPQSVISYHLEKNASILAIIVFLSVSMLILLFLQQKKYSFIFATISIYMIVLSLILDWLIPLDLTVLYTVFSIFSSTIIGFLIDKVWKIIIDKRNNNET